VRSNRFLAIGAALAIATAGLTGCSSDSSDSSSAPADGEKVTVKIGTTDADMTVWTAFADKAKEEGIELDVVKFTEFPPVNPALSEGQIEISKFQHILYLSQYNASAGQDLRIVGSGEINVLGLFWKDHTSLDGIEGEGIAIPNDPTNQGRAINVLMEAGLLTLRDGAPKLTPTPADIDTANSKVTVVPVDASQTPQAYSEGRPAVINNVWLRRAGLDPATAIAKDDASSELAEPYINVFAVRADDVDNPTYEKLVEIWHTPEVTDALNFDTNGNAVQVDRPKDELNEILERLEKDFR